ncbi:MAG: hypothetical protein HZB92_00560 [Euryarchaeota archaeon]|nr:hypothetical protein [Euryarchaeota archaeon]
MRFARPEPARTNGLTRLPAGEPARGAMPGIEQWKPVVNLLAPTDFTPDAQALSPHRCGLANGLDQGVRK